MKRTISVILAAVMIALTFSGCSSSDIALYKAMQNVPESSVTTTKTTFDIQVVEPVSTSSTTTYYEKDENGQWGEPEISTYEDDSAEVNYFLKVYSGLLSIMAIDSTVTKSGNDARTDIKIAYPDSMSTFTAWTQTDGENGNINYILSIPSYLRPYLPDAISKKQYISFDMAEYTEMIGDLTGLLTGGMTADSVGATDGGDTPASVGIIGGADGPTSIFTTSAVSPAGILENSDIFENILNFLDFELTSAATENGNTVYTVKIDSASLTTIVKGIIKSLSTDEAANLVGALALMSGAESSTEIREEFKEGVKYADEIADLICAKITETGLLADGITLKYTVNRQGYIIREESLVNLDLDFAKIIKAAEEIAEALSDGEKEEYESDYRYEYDSEIKGRIKVGVTSVSDVTRINEKLEVKVPSLTEENNINIIKDIKDYAEYSAAKSRWNSSWYSYNSIEAYKDMLEEGETLVLRNNDNGREVIVEPKIISDEEYYDFLGVPASDLCSIFDGVSVSWNGELMGVQISYTDSYGEKYTDLYLNTNGAIRYDEEYLSGEYDKYDGVYEWYTGNFTADGKFYVELDEFDYDFGFESRFEDGKFCYSSEGNAKFKYDKSMDGNLIYEFEKMFE
ncbi:MAG: hypothetical protein ACI4SS_06150 [Clostridia bacterium]